MARDKQQFKVIIERDEDGFFVGSVPALPGCYTQGRTLEELTERIKEAITLCLEQATADPAYRSRVQKLNQSPAFIAIETIEV